MSIQVTIKNGSACIDYLPLFPLILSSLKKKKKKKNEYVVF